MLKKHNLPVILISLFLFIIPFFWFPPGQVDLGGDSSRLYFYDPVAYLKNFSIYETGPEGTAGVAPNFYFLPFLFFLIALKAIIHSPYLLVDFFNSIKLVIGLLSIYGIIKTVLNTEYSEEKTQIISEVSALTGGMFYSIYGLMIGNYDKSLLSHNQVFLNPLMFFLLLKYFLGKDSRFLWAALLLSVVFAPNFAYTSAPPFFAFYPISVLFLASYIVFIKKVTIRLAEVSAAIVLFFFLQAFQLIPQIINLFEQGSYINTRVFDRASMVQEGIRYFLAVLPLAKVSRNILLPPLLKRIDFLSIIVPGIVLLGFLWMGKNMKFYLLTSLFFLVTLFLLSAHITYLGINFYVHLFFIPGFSMFRNFIGQWAPVYSFFYALLFGQAIFIVITHIQSKKIVNPYYILFFFAVFFVVSSWQFINGEIVNNIHPDTKNIHIAFHMDPGYEKTLSFIRTLPPGGKLITLPFSDPFYQVLSGDRGGAYVGPSIASYIAGIQDFTGYQIMPWQFGDTFLMLAKEKKYQEIDKLLSLLNIQHIFYNADPKIYDTTFYATPYTTVRTYLPDNQRDYAVFVSKIAGKQIYSNGYFHIFDIPENRVSPLFYAAVNVSFYRQNGKDNEVPAFVESKISDPRQAFIDEALCKTRDISQMCHNVSVTTIPTISFERINPTKYKVFIDHATDPFILVFSNQYHAAWKAFLGNENPGNSVQTRYFNGDVIEKQAEDIFFDKNTFETIGMEQIPDANHIPVNAYANAWIITPRVAHNRTKYELIIEMTQQKVFYLSLLVSTAVFTLLLVWGMYLFAGKRIVGIMRNRQSWNIKQTR